MSFLSAAWFDIAFEHAQRIEGQRQGLDCRLQFVGETGSGPVRWLQVISAGRIVDWRLGECENADLEVRCTVDHAWRIWRGEVDGTEALLGITVAESGPAGRRTGAPAPLDLLEQVELVDLPYIPGVTVDVQYEYRHGPFGSVDFALSVVDGQVDEMSLGSMAEPDVRVWAPFFDMAKLRRGDMTILEALAAGSTVDGAVGALALLVGFLEGPEYHQAELACGRSGFALGVLGEVTADPAYQAALGPLAARTGPPDVS